MNIKLKAQDIIKIQSCNNFVSRRCFSFIKFCIVCKLRKKEPMLSVTTEKQVQL